MFSSKYLVGGRWSEGEAERNSSRFIRLEPRSERLRWQFRLLLLVHNGYAVPSPPAPLPRVGEGTIPVPSSPTPLPLVGSKEQQTSLHDAECSWYVARGTWFVARCPMTMRSRKPSASTRRPRRDTCPVSRTAWFPPGKPQTGDEHRHNRYPCPSSRAFR